MDGTNKQALMKIERPVYLQDDLNEATLYKKPSESCKCLLIVVSVVYVKDFFFHNQLNLLLKMK